jgi:hypothetical protein
MEEETGFVLVVEGDRLMTGSQICLCRQENGSSGDWMEEGIDFVLVVEGYRLMTGSQICLCRQENGSSGDWMEEGIGFGLCPFLLNLNRLRLVRGDSILLGQILPC